MKGKSKMHSRRNGLSILPVGAILLGLIFWPGKHVQAEESLVYPAGPVLPESRPLRPFQLLDHSKAKFDLDRLKGKWTFLFFGYTHCPDTCPTVMAMLGEVFRQLGKQPNIIKDIQAVFVSVDPQRDTPEILEKYVPYFNPGFLGVTGKQGAVFSFARQVGAGYMISPEEDEEGNYLVSHSASIFLINPRAEYHAFFRPEQNTPKEISDLFSTIKTRFGE